MRENLPDKARAISLIQTSLSDMKYTLSLNITYNSANTLLRNIYECFRMLGEAALLAKGIVPQDHIVCIDELMKLAGNENSGYLEWLRRIRHNINYYGYKSTISDAQEAVIISNRYFNKLFEKVKEKLN